MSRSILFVVSLLAIAGSTTSAFAEEINLATTSSERPDVLQARTGVDHGFVVDLGYRRVVEWRGHQLLLGADLAVPWATPDLGDFRLRASAATAVLGGRGRGWKLAPSIGPTLRATQHAAGRSHALGVDVRLTGGYYGTGFWTAGELGLDWAATTHVSHGDEYRTTAHPGAKDGWYASPGGTLYAGLNAGLSFDSFDVLLRLGQPRSPGLEMQTIPFYVLAGVNVRLPR